MPIFGEKQVTSVTIKINQLTTPHYNDEVDESMELHLSDLLHLIKIQPTSGAVEAARAIRKKIKYGELSEEQLRSLSLLELLILNSGSKTGPVIARDDKLIDVLKGILNGSGKTGTGSLYDTKVYKKVKGLAIGWKDELDGLDGYKYFASLWKNIKGANGGSTSNGSRSHRRTESGTNIFDSAEDNKPKSSPSRFAESSPSNTPPPRPTTASPYSKSATSSSSTRKDKSKSKDKKRRKKKGKIYADEQYRIPQINYKVEASRIRTLIGDCHTHTTALLNKLITLPVGVSPLDDDKCSKEFEKCRSIRRKVLRYLQFVGAGSSEDKSAETIAMDEEFLGSLIYANEQLVQIFKKFDASCGYTEENPAPQYDDEDVDEDGYESYYTDSLLEDEEDEEEEQSLLPDLHERLRNATILEGSSSKKPPPPRPVKPAGLGTKKLQQPQLPPSLTKHTTNDTIGSDPFGDGNADQSLYQ